MIPEMNKLSAGAYNQFLFRFASFNRRFVENVQRQITIHRKIIANKLFDENKALVRISKK